MAVLYQFSARPWQDEKGKGIGHVRYINILTWIRGFRVKIANFQSFFSLWIPKRDLDTAKKTTPNIEVCPGSLGAMLEYWYIERGLLSAAFRRYSAFYLIASFNIASASDKRFKALDINTIQS